MEEDGVAVRAQRICFVFRGCFQAMVRHHLYRHLRGPCWWMPRHTSHVVSTLLSIDGKQVSHIHIGGYLVFGRADVHGDSFGIKSIAALEWSVCGPHPPIYVCDL